MSDATTLEFKTEAREPIKVKDVSKVPLKRGQIFLNAGQTSTLKEEYSHLFDVGVVTVYNVAGQSDSRDSEYDTAEMCLVNLAKMSNGLLPYSEEFMNIFVPIINEQLKTDLISTQSAKLLVEMGGADNLKFVRAKRTFAHNSKTVSHFLDQLNGLGKFDSVQKFGPEIEETIATGEEQFGKKAKFGRGLKGWFFERKDYAQNDYTEAEKSSMEYRLHLNKKIEKHDLVIRTDMGARKASSFSVVNVSAPENFDWENAYDINTQGTHTTGRRNGIKDFMKDGIDPYETPAGKDFNETAAVVCGYVASPDHAFQDTETVRSNYGHIFDPESEGFIVVMGSEVTKSEGYEVVGVEARLKQKVTPQMTKAIVVGNEKMEAEALAAVTERGLSIPVILMSKTVKDN